MAENKIFTITCRSHNEEICRFYCKECADFICPQCLEGSHESHTFSTIKGADADIRQMLKKFVDAKEGECISVQSLSDAANDRRKQLETDKVSVIEEIDSNVERIIQKVQGSKTTLLVELDNIVCHLNKDIDSVQSRLKKMAVTLAEQDITGLDSNDVLQLFSETRDFVFLYNTILAKSIPKFVSAEQVDICVPLGNFEIEEHERKDKTDSCITGSDLEENASDELAENTNPITINCQNMDFWGIEELVPVSNNEAWVIFPSITDKYKLQKIVNGELEKTVYKEYVNYNKPTPFPKFKLLMKDGCFLTTWNTELRITRTLKDMRTVPYTHISENCPYGISVLDDAVFVYVCCQENNSFSSFENIIQFDRNGIKTNELTVPGNCKNEHPLDVEVKRTGDYCIFHYILFSEIYWQQNQTIRLLKQNTETGNVECLSEFSGVFGQIPSKEFKCGGFCIDKDNVIVCDRNYESVYVLDGKDLKFKKILIYNTYFKLVTPSCVAVSDDFLWLVDGEKVYKFKYDREKNELYL